MSRLEEAGIRDADIFFALTDGDEVNIASSHIARTVFGVETVVVLIRDDEKSILAKNWGIKVICPSLLSRREMEEIMVENDEGKNPGKEELTCNRRLQAW